MRLAVLLALAACVATASLTRIVLENTEYLLFVENTNTTPARGAARLQIHPAFPWCPSGEDCTAQDEVDPPHPRRVHCLNFGYGTHSPDWTCTAFGSKPILYYRPVFACDGYSRDGDRYVARESCSLANSTMRIRVTDCDALPGDDEINFDRYRDEL